MIYSILLQSLYKKLSLILEIRMMKFKPYEDETTEFKRELTDSLEKEVVAFLNSQKGGDIYIGVEDNGTVLGVQNPDKLQLLIVDRIRNNILPNTLGFFDVVIKEIDNKQVLHIIVARGTERPYYLKKYGLSPAGAYLRIGSGKQQLTTAMIDHLLASRSRNSLRNIPSPRANLTFNQLKIYYEEKGFAINSSFLDSLDLYTSSGQFNYVAYLLADRNSVSIKVAKFAGTDKVDLIENEEYGFCSLIKATNRVLDKLQIENRTFTKVTGAAERLERRMIEERALREAIINAFIHNDYTFEVPPVFEIYSNRLAVISYGGLVAGLSREDFLAGRSMPRNRELMRVFRDLDMVEQLGSGMNRMLGAYSPDIFKLSENFLEVSFDFASEYKEPLSLGNHDSGLDRKLGNGLGNKLGNAAPKAKKSRLRLGNPQAKLGNGLGNRLGNKLGNKLDDRLGNAPTEIHPAGIKDKILKRMREDAKISATKLALELSLSQTAIEKHIKQLREAGQIKRVGGTRGHWQVL